MATPKICAVEGCEKPILSRGWCNAHYLRWRKHGTPEGGLHLSDNTGTCSVAGCERGAKLRGLCRRHHHRLLRHGAPDGGAAYHHGQHREWIHRLLAESTDECILWPFTLAPNGYGVTHLAGCHGAHRAVCVIAHGDPPTARHETAHSCNVRACVNPRHLRWATAAENMADKTRHGTQLIGERNHQARLDEVAVREIRALRGGVYLREAAALFGVSISTIHRIWRGETWKWLKEHSEVS